MTLPDTLLHLPLFRTLSASRRDALLRRAERRQYPKGATIFAQDAPAEAVWFVLGGWVHLMRWAGADRQRGVLLFTVTPNEALCGISAIEADTYTATAVAGTAVEVLRVPGEAVHALMVQEPEFAYQLLRLCAERIRLMAIRYGSMADPVSQRVVQAILQLRRQFGPAMPVTHRELAQMAWTTTESAIRVVGRLKRAGCVTGSRGRLVIVEERPLKRIIAGRGNGAL